jgi:hypothetical protein
MGEMAYVVAGADITDYATCLWSLDVRQRDLHFITTCSEAGSSHLPDHHMVAYHLLVEEVLDG